MSGFCCTSFLLYLGSIPPFFAQTLDRSTGDSIFFIGFAFFERHKGLCDFSCGNAFRKQCLLFKPDLLGLMRS